LRALHPNVTHALERLEESDVFSIRRDRRTSELRVAEEDFAIDQRRQCRVVRILCSGGPGRGECSEGRDNHEESFIYSCHVSLLLDACKYGWSGEDRTRMHPLSGAGTAQVMRSNGQHRTTVLAWDEWISR